MKSYKVCVVALIGTVITECVRTGTMITISKIAYRSLGSDLKEVAKLCPPWVPE